MNLHQHNKCLAAGESILRYNMRSPDDSDPVKSNPDAQYPEAQERDIYTLHDAEMGDSRLEREGKPQQWGCTSCMYYDPGCAYCSYIHAPVDVLFVCPQVLDRRRWPPGPPQ